VKVDPGGAAGEDTYRISLALAGFAPDEIAITAQQNKLTITGRKAEHEQTKSDQQFLYQGISARAFERQFNLEDHVEVEQASFETDCSKSNSCGRFLRQ
jgi:molecular chaperone IbpA